MFFYCSANRHFSGTPCIHVKWSPLLGRRRTDVSAHCVQDGLSQGALELMCNNTFGYSQYGLPHVLEFQLFRLFEYVTYLSLVHSALYKTKYAPREYVL